MRHARMLARAIPIIVEGFFLQHGQQFVVAEGARGGVHRG